MNHIRKLVGQWQQCAAKSKVARVKEFYAQMLNCVQIADKQCWQHLVYETEVYVTLHQHPKVYLNVEEEIMLAAHKRKEYGQLGPDPETSNSVERKLKGLATMRT